MTDLGEIVSFVTTESPIKSDASALSIVSATAGLKVRVLAAEAVILKSPKKITKEDTRHEAEIIKRQSGKGEHAMRNSWVSPGVLTY